MRDQKTGTIEKCSICHSDFYVPKWWKAKGGGRFCSKECLHVSLRGRAGYWAGKKRPFAHRKMQPGFMPVHAFKKGQTPWNKGKPVPNIRDDKNCNWIGDSVGYHGLHDWVRVRLGRPSKCEMCGTTENRTYHWANKSGKYKRELSDWIRLCVSCHRRRDGSARKAWVTRKKNESKRASKELPNSR